jgi:hypothetical protein
LHSLQRADFANIFGASQGGAWYEVSEKVQIDFDVPAVLRKWPSLSGQRLTAGTGPYLLLEGTLDQRIREFVAKPLSMRHLYEIHTAAQPHHCYIIG